jgi:hypothetical protein
MPQQLLQEAIQRAEQTTPAVRAAALVHIARVLAVFDKNEAVRLLDRGIALAEGLPPSDRDILLPELACTAAAVSPDLAWRLAASLRNNTDPISDRIAITMMDHGHNAEVAHHLGGPYPEGAYPFHALLNSMGSCGNDRESQRTILRGAMKAATKDPGNLGRYQFLEVFNYYWMMLPAHEAAEFVRELINFILDERDQQGQQRRSRDGKDVYFTSMRQCQIFDIFGPLRRLAPDLAESLIQQYPQLAKAVAIFPYGIHEFTEAPVPAPRREKPIDPSELLEWDFVNSHAITVEQWLKTSWEEMFEYAMVEFANDTALKNPNQAPREVWPSTQSFRTLMYKAGRYEGYQAIRRLDRISDPDSRLLAEIELIAGIVGLAQLGYSTRAPLPVEETLSAEDKEIDSPNLATLPIRWDGRGRIRAVKTEFAEWDKTKQKWAGSQRAETSTFRTDLQLAQRASGASSVQFEYDDGGKLNAILVSRNGDTQAPFLCAYDDRGRLVRVAQETAPPQPPQADPFGGSMHSSMWFETNIDNNGFRIGGAVEVAIRYDEANRPLELSYVMGAGQMRCRVLRTWNSAGLLESETLIPDMPGDLPPTPGSLLTFVYDSQGRRVEFKCSMYGGMEFHSTFLYDDHDNMVEANAGGQHQRFEYRYDSQGNWIERETWTWSEPAREYQPASIERRAIEYR